MKVGDTIPDFALPDQDWNTLKSEDLLGKPIVVYFYPKDDTPGCTKQACTFRDQFAIFQELGAQVIGVSGDSPEVHRKFQEKYRIPFRLLSDLKGELRKKFEVSTTLFGLLPGRVTFVFDTDGKLVHTFNSNTKAERHITEAIEALKSL
jgi:thioredoxin-dependent peroxiredoxin